MLNQSTLKLSLAEPRRVTRGTTIAAVNAVAKNKNPM